MTGARVHPLLQRQLRKLSVDAGSPPNAEQWKRLIERITRTYEQADQDRYTIERSLMVSSREMQDVCARLARSEASFKGLVERSPDSIFVRAGHTILYANAAMADLLGIPDAAELVGASSLAHLHPDDVERLVRCREMQVEGKDIGLVEARWVRRDGAVAIVEGGSSAILFDGAPAWLTVVRDVTTQRKAEEEIERAASELRLSEERYRVLFDGMPLPIILFDPATLEILQANDAALQLYGYTETELLARTMTDLKVERDDPELRQVASVAPPSRASGRAVRWRGMKQHRRKDGSTLDLEITSHLITVGGRRAVLAQNVDVTEKLRLEEQLRQSQKMEAVGRLAGGIAHDFNNILAVILADADYAKEQVGEDEQLKSLLEEIESAAARAASLTHQLLAFSRRQVLQPRVLSLNVVVSEMDRMLRRIIGEDVKLELELDPLLASVKADPGQLEQVIMNLVVNARDALPPGGRVTIRTQNANAAPSEIGSDCVVLTVSDDGTGMDAETVARIFEPFFTTKAVGKGTGLGLATVFGIVKQSGGVVHVVSEIGHGSSFNVFLPRVDEPALCIERTSQRMGAVGSERVLLVEDDPHVRRAVTQALERRGYTVVQANDGEDAVCRFRSAHAFDMVVTDLVMPGMDGVAVVRHLREGRPELPALYISGYTEHPSMREGDFGERTAFLNKPFTADEIAHAVRSLLRKAA